MLGLPIEDLPIFLEFKEAVVRPEGATADEQQANMHAAGERIYEYLSRTLETRRAGSPGDDLIGGLISTQSDGSKLSDQEILDITYLLVIAGLDTVTSSLSCLLAWFAEHPAERRSVIDDAALLPKAIEELLRFESPVPLGHRWVTEDIEIADAGSPAVRWSRSVLAAANVDPAAFRIRSRSTSVGCATRTWPSLRPHRCLGSNLARLELRVAIEEFHRRIPEYAITAGQPVVYTNYGVRAAVQLPISFPPA